MHVIKMADVNLAGKRVFIRADLNVPQDDAGKITDDTRIRASVPAVQYALKAGAAVMVTSHLGRPTEGELRSPADSLGTDRCSGGRTRQKSPCARLSAIGLTASMSGPAAW